VPEFEKQMRRKVHYVIEPQHLWSNIANMARTQDMDLAAHAAGGFQVHRNRVFPEHVSGAVFRD
jgi:type I restriction enzyme M protein